MLWALEEAPDGSSARQSLARAPRPVLHLLRSNDLAKVEAAQRSEIYDHNVSWRQRERDFEKDFDKERREEQLLNTLGLDAFEDLLRQCG